MKYIILLCLLNINLLNATNVIFLPQLPKAGDTVTIEYHYDFRIDENVDLYAIFYNFEKDKFKPFAEEVLLTLDKTKNIAKGKYIVNDKAVYILSKIFQFDKNVLFEENNKRRFWEFKVIKNNRPQVNTYYHKAMTMMGNVPQNYNRMTDLIGAKKSLEKEILYFPKNNAAKIAYETIRLDLRLITYNEYEENVLKILKSKINFNNEIDLKTSIRALKAVNKSKEANNLSNKYINKYPLSDIAEEEFIQKISLAESFEEFDKLSFEYFKKFKNSKNKGGIFSALISSYHKKRRAPELVEKFKQLENVPLKSLGELALKIALDSNYFADSTDKFKYAYSYLIFKKEFMKLNKNVYEKNYQILDNRLSAIENKKRNYYLLNSLFVTYARIANNFNDFKSKLLTYNDSYKLLGYLSGEESIYFYLYGFKIKNNPKEGVIASENIFRKGIISDSLTSLYKFLVEKSGYNYDPVKKIDSIEKAFEYIRLDNLFYQKLDGKYISGILQQTDETLVDIDDLKGKIKVFFFWTTWCGPCQSSFPILEQLQEEYFENDNIYIAGVNSWENQDGRDEEINDFLTKFNPKINILIDPTDTFPQLYGITGLPTILIIDKENQIQFIEKGFTNDLDNLINKVKLLERTNKK